MTVEDLTSKQTAFVDAIISGANGAAAYVTAGYTAPNTNTATAGASRLLANVKISTAIARRTDSDRERHDIDLDWLTTRYKRIFTESMQSGEYTSARQALDSIAKQHGLAGDSHSTIDVQHSGSLALESVPLSTLSQLLDAIDHQTTMLSIEAPVSEILTPESGI